jgi:hypothetical protein
MKETRRESIISAITNEIKNEFDEALTSYNI